MPVEEEEDGMGAEARGCKGLLTVLESGELGLAAAVALELDTAGGGPGEVDVVNGAMDSEADGVGLADKAVVLLGELVVEMAELGAGKVGGAERAVVHSSGAGVSDADESGSDWPVSTGSGMVIGAGVCVREVIGVLLRDVTGVGMRDEPEMRGTIMRVGSGRKVQGSSSMSTVTSWRMERVALGH